MLKISKADMGKVISHARAEYPNEACGILAGVNGKVLRVYAMRNIQASPDNFLMEPAEQFKVAKDMRNNDLTMLGIYHSHVASQPYPSSTDCQMAYYPDVDYLIVSLKETEKPVAKSYKIVDGRITEEVLEIEDESFEEGNPQ
jgi:proteasome lid subunit RPN8/RPN11